MVLEKYLGNLYFIIKFVIAVIQSPKFVDVLLIFPCHFGFRATASLSFP